MFFIVFNICFLSLSDQNSPQLVFHHFINPDKKSLLNNLQFLDFSSFVSSAESSFFSRYGTATSAAWCCPRYREANNASGVNGRCWCRCSNNTPDESGPAVADAGCPTIADSRNYPISLHLAQSFI